MIPDMGERANRVVLIGIDGLLIEHAVRSGAAPALTLLRDEGFFAHSEIEGPTISGPSWATILTGASTEEHGIVDNEFLDHRLESFPDLFAQAKSHGSISTLAAAGWPPLVTVGSEGPIIREADHLIEFDGETHGYFDVDRQVFEATARVLTKERPEMSFVYFCEADEAAHKYGVIAGPYYDAIARIDGYVDRLFSLAHEISLQEGHPCLFAITTDHGHVDEGGHGGHSSQERQTFLIGKGINRSNPNWSIDYRPKEIPSLLISEL